MPLVLRWVGRVLRRQSVKPPRQTPPLSANKFCRWSLGLNAWLPSSSRARIPHCVALEGCGSAFNALNAMRTALFFGTRQPPVLLNVRGWQDINQLRQRQETVSSKNSSSSSTNKTSEEDLMDVEDISNEDESNSSSSSTSNCDSNVEGEMPPILLFGDDAFLSNSSSSGSKSPGEVALTDLPIVAVENYVPGATSIHRTRLPGSGCRLVMGHENTGVSPRFLMRRRDDDQTDESSTTKIKATNEDTHASQVVFVPQFGTISSLNVVTSMGIALFYAFMDARYPMNRTIVEEETSQPTAAAPQATAAAAAKIAEYQKWFAEALPTIETNKPESSSSPSSSPPESSSGSSSLSSTTPVSAWTASGRVDKRPIHPVYYGREVDEIKSLHRKYHDSLLRLSDSKYVRRKISGSTFEKTYTPRFGLSVLYSNDEDGRNFGGLVRNSNAFLVDEVLYYGKRRKVNVVGAVGSQHYTPVVYLGDPGEDDGEGEVEEVTGEGVIEPYPSIPEEEFLRYVGAALRSEVTRRIGASPQWWLLDCGQLRTRSDAVSQSTHLLASWDWLCAQRNNTNNSSESGTSVLSLCDDEETLRRATQPNGVLLVIPPEGSLPHMGVLSQCTRVLRIVPDKDSEENSFARGLPSPVASGIALERLSAVMHPKLRT